MADTSALDMALDDSIKAHRKPQTSKRGRGGPMRRGGQRSFDRGGRASPYRTPRPPKGNSDGVWRHDMYEELGRGIRGSASASGPRQRQSGGSSEPGITVENLYYEVTEDDLRELFSQIGPLKKVVMHWDESGRAKGSATMVFEDAGDARRAINTYNNVELDGQPMRISFSNNDVSATGKPRNIALRLGGVARNVLSRLGTQNGGAAKPRGGSRGGRGGRGGRSSGKPRSENDLDAEMEAYMKGDAQGSEDVAME